MRNIKLTIAYDGTRFVGWQRQAEGESVQGLLEDALGRIEGSAVTVHGAGRTDAGVHALGQVASVRLACRHDAAVLARALNGQLPDDVRVVEVAEVADDFHARFSARWKTYRYLLRNAPLVNPFDRAYMWHVPEMLDRDAMRAAALALAGTHDFAAFRSTGSDTTGTVRTISRSEVIAVDELPLAAVPGRPLSERHEHSRPSARSDRPVLAYEVTGNGFLRHMVRAVMGTLVEIGRGRRTASSIEALLAGGSREAAGATAPPHGLFLIRVDYD